MAATVRAYFSHLLICRLGARVNVSSVVVVSPPRPWPAERTREGLDAARQRGRVGGRPPALSPAQKEEVQRMRDEEGRPIANIAQLFKVSAKTVRRV